MTLREAAPLPLPPLCLHPASTAMQGMHVGAKPQ